MNEHPLIKDISEWVITNGNLYVYYEGDLLYHWETYGWVGKLRWKEVAQSFSHWHMQLKKLGSSGWL